MSDRSHYLQEVKGLLDGPPCRVCGAIMVPHARMVNGEVIEEFFGCLSCGEDTRPS
jgi:hypothetical protein